MKYNAMLLRITVSLVAIIAGLIPVSFGLELRGGLSKAQAIEQAEAFVKNNGYTSLLPDKAKLKYEVFDSQERNVEAVLANRRNLLQAKSYCLAEDEEYWCVGFLYRIQRQSALRGRAVLVRKDGRAIRIAHLDPDFSHFTKL